MDRDSTPSNPAPKSLACVELSPQPNTIVPRTASNFWCWVIIARGLSPMLAWTGPW
jgi:hypothetical protein